MRKKFKKSDLLISKFKSSVTINRTLKTNFKKLIIVFGKIRSLKNFIYSRNRRVYLN